MIGGALAGLRIVSKTIFYLALIRLIGINPTETVNWVRWSNLARPLNLGG